MYLKNDITGEIADFANYQIDWSPADSEGTPVPEAEVDAYLLADAKISKNLELKSDLTAFCDAGYLYTAKSATFKLDDVTIINVTLKDTLPASVPDRYKFYDIDKIKIDFVDNSGFMDFRDALFEEKDRIMIKYNDYRKQIIDAADMETLEAIVISFSA